jgi:hypothetical protein
MKRAERKQAAWPVSLRLQARSVYYTGVKPEIPCIQHHGLVGTTAALYSGSIGFEPQTGDRLY